MPRQRPVPALLGGSPGKVAVPEQTHARDSKARPPSTYGWEIMPMHTEHTVSSQARGLPAAPKVLQPFCATGKGNRATERE